MMWKYWIQICLPYLFYAQPCLHLPCVIRGLCIVERTFVGCKLYEAVVSILSCMINACLGVKNNQWKLSDQVVLQNGCPRLRPKQYRQPSIGRLQFNRRCHHLFWVVQRLNNLLLFCLMLSLRERGFGNIFPPHPYPHHLPLNSHNLVLSQYRLT